MNLLLKQIQHLDVVTFLWANVEHRCQYRRTVRAISRSADGPLYVLLGFCLVLLDGERGFEFFILTLSAYFLEVALYLFFKNTIKRDRPSVGLQHYDAWIVPSDKFSFPSGHTAAAFVFAWMIASFYPEFSLPAFLWAALVGVSRVLQGVHYPTDILAGAALGCCCAYLSLSYL